MATTHKKIIKKKTNHFKRMHSDRFKRVGESWRAPRGIDCPVRRRFRGSQRMVTIGYASDAKTKNMLPCGLYKVAVRNVNDLEALIMTNKVFAAEIASAVSTPKRLAIIKRAAELNVRVLNADAKVRTEEQK